jgi:hypothetical protein
MEHRTRQNAFVSLLKTSFVLSICVLINLFGVLSTQITKSILFIDLCGTAIASLTFGPLHGALVGLISNYMGEFVIGPVLNGASVNLKYYFLFAPVHIMAAFVWSIVPRLLRGKLVLASFSATWLDLKPEVALFG